MFHPQGPTFLELARQGLSSTQRGYDLLAPKFDYTPFRTPEAIVRVVGERLARRGRFVDGLDLCCGTGVGLRMLQPLCARRVVGLDFSAGMLAEARHQLGERANVALVQGNALALGFEQTFDVVTCFGALGHIPRGEERRFVAGIFRALRPGGLFACVSVPMPRPFSRSWLFGRGYNAVAHLRNRLVQPPFVMCYLTFTLEELLRLLAGAGFVVTVERDLFPTPYQHAALVLARRPLLQAGGPPPPDTAPKRSTRT
ncbi:MAG TPA: class I SAM-dependent methyltransferase [Chloroflexota bacterium]|nr:class I SAM-dependent methyltransferase [Chloroflexota bacterium]